MSSVTVYENRCTNDMYYILYIYISLSIPNNVLCTFEAPRSDTFECDDSLRQQIVTHI